MKNNKNILKWFNNDISDEDLAQLKNDEDFKIFEKIAHYSSQIEVPTVDVEKAFLDFKQKNKKGKVVAFNFNNLYKYAAAIVLLVTSTYFLFFNTTKEFKTSYAETKSLLLPDNSKVTLNSKSNLSFSSKDWDNNRVLDLDGEAYFKVAKGKTFTVNTDLGKVTVLGTEFNVKDRKDYFEVKTYEGLVKVSFNKTTVNLSKGKLFRVVNNKIDTTSIFNINDGSWLQKESNFKSTPLKFVLNEIENKFGYVIEIKNVDTNKLFTGGFSHEDVNLALQSVTIPLQLSYKIDNKKITIFNYED